MKENYCRRDSDPGVKKYYPCHCFEHRVVVIKLRMFTIRLVTYIIWSTGRTKMLTKNAYQKCIPKMHTKNAYHNAYLKIEWIKLDRSPSTWSKLLWNQRRVKTKPKNLSRFNTNTSSRMKWQPAKQRAKILLFTRGRLAEITRYVSYIRCMWRKGRRFTTDNSKNLDFFWLLENVPTVTIKMVRMRPDLVW